MLRRIPTALVLTLAPVVTQADSLGADLTVVVERGETTIEVFFAQPAENLVDVFALPPERLEDDRGIVAFEPLRLGTWLIGDDVIAGTETLVDGKPEVFEAMSLMVHPEDQKLPMYDAFDGFIAIAVCSVEPPEDPTLDMLYSYVGYIAYPEDPDAPLAFTLPKTGRDAITVEMREFRAGELLSETQVTLADGGAITLDAAPEPTVSIAGIGLWAMLAGLGLGAGALGLRHLRHA